MSRKLAPKSFWSFPMFRFPFSIFEEGEEEGWMHDLSEASGLSVSEDENSVYIEAAVPGLKPEEIEVTFERGILWIKGERKDEMDNKSKKFYRKSMSTFSYRIAVPGDVDESKQPDATCKHGVIRIVFHKNTQSQPKKIPIKPS